MLDTAGIHRVTFTRVQVVLKQGNGKLPCAGADVALFLETVEVTDAQARVGCDQVLQDKQEGSVGLWGVLDGIDTALLAGLD